MGIEYGNSGSEIIILTDSEDECIIIKIDHKYYSQCAIGTLRKAMEGLNEFERYSYCN